MPHLFPGRGRYALAVEPRLYGLRAVPFGGQPEYALHNHSLGFINKKPIASLVVAEAVGRFHRRYYLALPSLLELAPPGPLHDLSSLVLGELVEDAVRELPLRAFVSPIVEGPDHGPMLLELTPEQVVVGGLSREVVPKRGGDHRDTACGH